MINGHIERLSIGSELVALEVAPLVTHGAQSLLFAIEYDVRGSARGFFSSTIRVMST